MMYQMESLQCAYFDYNLDSDSDDNFEIDDI